MRNPIFVEYYSHMGCDCYKMLLPWSEYREEKVVLCKADEGVERAWELARSVIKTRLEEGFRQHVIS